MATSRRALLAAFLSLPFAHTFHLRALAQSVPGMPLTPACIDADDLTPAREAGPFFKPNSPPVRDLYSGSPDGERITVAGFVFNSRCQPLPGSLVEIWHADETGQYDRDGFRLRGHQFTDSQGRWWFNTIVPALYPGRTRHFHFKVQRPGGTLLTTQLFFPGESGNAEDWIFHESLLLALSRTGDGQFGRFDFIV